MTSVSEVIERYSSVGWEELATLISKGFLVLDSTFESVTDITVIHIVRTWEVDHLPCVSFFFRDGRGRLRYAEVLYNEYGPGMVAYASSSDVAKRDLIHEVNRFYEYAGQVGEDVLKDWEPERTYVCRAGGKYYAVVDDDRAKVKVAFVSVNDLHLFNGCVEWQLKTDVEVRIFGVVFNTSTDALAWYLYKRGLVKCGEAHKTARLLLVSKGSKILRM